VTALPAPVRALIEAADTVLGSERLVADLADSANARTWSPPLETMLAEVESLRGTPTVILATGDPNWFGIGVTLAHRLEQEEFALHPAPSAFQLAAARLHWPLQNVAAISLHGRPVAALHPHLLPGNRILALTGGSESAREAARLMVGRGYGPSPITVLESLGSSGERLLRTTASALCDQTVGEFHTLAIDCLPEAGAAMLPCVPGLPDTAFVHDGQLTKRDVRATTLAKLAPAPGALLWDVGAGCGSIGVEWMRAARDARAIAFERDATRCAMIGTNAIALGVPGLAVVRGEAPSVLDTRPTPDAIFLGGDVSDEALFRACWQALRPGGRLVANAVTLDGEVALIALRARLGGELTRIGIEVLETIGEHHGFAPRRTVTQWSMRKEAPQ
jgi:precorrin-6Y C5,15-methyltransferase (decarboxylating)